MKEVVKKFVCEIYLILLKSAFIQKYNRFLISTCLRPELRNRCDNIIYQYIFLLWTKSIYLKEKDPDKRENLKSIAMGEKAGVQWAKYYLSRPLPKSGPNKEFYVFLESVCRN